MAVPRQRHIDGAGAAKAKLDMMVSVCWGGECWERSEEWNEGEGVKGVWFRVFPVLCRGDWLPRALGGVGFRDKRKGRKREEID